MPSALAISNVAEHSNRLESLRTQLLNHAIYNSVQTADSLRLFMREHVFAVWDFMSLLKRLQQVVTCTTVPWLPVADSSLCRFVNEIVLGEECDEDGRGGYASHFELYLQAMDEVDADSQPIRDFIAQLKRGVSSDDALDHVPILPSTRAFVRTTLKLLQSGHPHEVAAAFFYGREDVIPDMFSRLVESLPTQGVQVERLVHYLKRHIELDANDHGPLARRLVDSLCGGQPEREHATIESACRAISHRIALWDDVLSEIAHPTA